MPGGCMARVCVARVGGMHGWDMCGEGACIAKGGRVW